MRQRWYVGVRGNTSTAFPSPSTPTINSHGQQYAAVIGPFLTRRGALWAEKYGRGNPHCQHVNDAEYFAKQENT